MMSKPPLTTSGEGISRKSSQAHPAAKAISLMETMEATLPGMKRREAMSSP